MGTASCFAPLPRLSGCPAALAQIGYNAAEKPLIPPADPRPPAPAEQPAPGAVAAAEAAPEPQPEQPPEEQQPPQPPQLLASMVVDEGSDVEGIEPVSDSDSDYASGQEGPEAGASTSPPPPRDPPSPTAAPADGAVPQQGSGAQ